MAERLRRATILLLAMLGPSRAAAVTVEIYNPVGAVSVKVSLAARLRVQATGAHRTVTREDTKITRTRDLIVIHCDPADKEPMDLSVVVPLGFSVDVTTLGGDIEIEGLIREAWIKTQTGSIRLSVPWDAIRLQLDAEQRPKIIELPRSPRFSSGKLRVSEERTIWRLRDRLPVRQVTYGRIRVRADGPGRVRLENQPIPADSPIKMPWQAPEAVDRILQKSRRPAPAAKSVPAAPAPSVRVPSAGTEISPRGEGATVFRSGVRMVNLLVAVVDAGGHPVTDLSPEDFAIVEDGEPQQVEFAGSEDLPFNLAILLDLSGSNRLDRTAMIAASKRFVEMAGDQDRVAIYALAGDLFHVVAPLTSDRASLIATLSKIPGVSGGSPLYDAIALAYAEELHDREGERNALVIVSDGIDDRLSPLADAPSRLKFRRLLKAAGQMNALLYSVFLRSGERFGQGWSKKARKQMQQLAGASHGRVFEARSIQDLEPVYPLLASELRGIYSVAYYPSNQDFRGRWRKVQVKVRRPGATPRTRKGYFAR